MRSSITMSWEAAKAWVKVSERMDAANTDQTKMGSLPQVMPGARMKAMVTRKFSPPRMDDSPKVMMARANRSWPGAFTTDRGG